MERVCLICALALLAACATPREACLRAAGSELATLDRLISETRGNLARGYAIDAEPYTTTGLELCAGRGTYGGRVNAGFRYCTTTETRYRDRPVAIDPAAERRKLAELEQARLRAADQTTRRALACPAPD